MQGGSFQRYVWVQGERKRQRNRSKYEEKRRRYLENDRGDVESPVKPKVVWPGEFENQLKRRERKLAKKEQLEGFETPAVRTPSDTHSLISEDIDPEPSQSEQRSEELISPREPTQKIEKKERRQSNDPVAPQEVTHYSDEFLDPPQKLNPSSTGGLFFLVSSNLINGKSNLRKVVITAKNSAQTRIFISTRLRPGRVMNEFHAYYPPPSAPFHHPLPHHGPTTTTNNAHASWNYPQAQHLENQSLDYPDTSMTHGSNQQVYHHNQHMDDSDMMMDESDYSQYHQMYAEEDEMVEGMTARAVHQCNVCNKIFVSYKGLQQHAVIHTDQKPFRCDICSKSFRFKSNLFEHRSVHTGFTPHACPYCGKTCRLKGNLKKHLRTHVTTKEELEAAWRPFASNRRPPADIPDDAIIVRGAGGSYYTPPPRPKKSYRKLGLGEPEHWITKLRRGEILHQIELDDKIRRLEDTIFNNLSLDRCNSLFDIAKSIAFETHDCPSCKVTFMTRLDCMSHHNMEHDNNRLDYFCEKCFRPFADEGSYQQHMSYHLRVTDMFDNGTINRSEPDILVPTVEEFHMLFDGSLPHMLDQQMVIH